MSEAAKGAKRPGKRQIILCTIHQPRKEIWDLFTHTLILGTGGYQVRPLPRTYDGGMHLHTITLMRIHIYDAIVVYDLGPGHPTPSMFTAPHLPPILLVWTNTYPPPYWSDQY